MQLNLKCFKFDNEPSIEEVRKIQNSKAKLSLEDLFFYRVMKTYHPCGDAASYKSWVLNHFMMIEQEREKERLSKLCELHIARLRRHAILGNYYY